LNQPPRLLEPFYFEQFRCIGAACEDTCCNGWTVHVDKATYGKYQECSDAHLAASLHTLVTINEKSSGDDDYAQIKLSGDGCQFLDQGLCSIQQRLGEEYLSNMCATYPRVVNRAGEVWQRSLDLSCPEAARMALLDPRPMQFHEAEFHDGAMRPGNIPALDVSALSGTAEPYRLFRDVRQRVIAHLQDRSLPIAQRLLRVGRVSEELAGHEAGDPPPESPPAAQLEMVLDLIVARISSDANPKRFLECYREFMQGLAWTPKSTMEEIGERYEEAYSSYYVPFLNGHEHMLEHMLVNYAHRTLFPLGLPESNRRLAQERAPGVTAQYMLMVAQYAIVRTLLIGMAGFHKEALGAAHAIKLIQACAKTFEHSLAFPGLAIAMLADKGMTTPRSLYALTAF
jgi:lysine-N-methylase